MTNLHPIYIEITNITPLNYYNDYLTSLLIKCLLTTLATVLATLGS
jgi:hypothetical protein